MTNSDIPIRLLNQADIERIIAEAESVMGHSDRELFLCTIMEILETAEAARKRKPAFDLHRFRDWWQRQKTERGAFRDGSIHVAALDQERLADALFDRDERHFVVGLWKPAVDRAPGPDRTVRRLILRPTGQAWWGEEIYQEMESWYEGQSYADA